MIKFPPLVKASFLERRFRFLVRCQLKKEGTEVLAHLPNSGRLNDLLAPGTPLWLSHNNSPQRKTRWSVVLAHPEGLLSPVSLDTRLPNALFSQAIGEGQLCQFKGWILSRSEAKVGTSRFDFLLVNEKGLQKIVEVKSVTLVDRLVAQFPDAVTERGLKHVTELKKLTSAGYEAAVVFIVQRSDVDSVTAARAIDPQFAAALDEARDSGVSLMAWNCSVTPEGISLNRCIPVV